MLVTPYVSILDALVARALKNSQLSCGETYAYFGEGPHELARIIFHGKRNELRQRYREGQEDQLGALGLVVNAVVLWNTIYMDAALAELRAEGFAVRDEDVARLSPLGHGHLNVLGRYAFTLPEFVARGELRPLRRPGELSDDGA